MTENRGPAKSWVAIILAIGIAVAVNVIVAAVLYDAIFSEGPGLSDNATQVLTGAFGGIIGVLGSYIGYTVAQAQGVANGTHIETTERPTAVGIRDAESTQIPDADESASEESGDK